MPLGIFYLPLVEKYENKISQVDSKKIQNNEQKETSKKAYFPRPF